MRSITILDKDYLKWVETLISRYQQSQVLASVRVNAEQLRFNFLLGRDIVEMQVEGEIGDKTLVQIHPQAGGKFTNAKDSQKIPEIFCIPWGHHKLILDKVKGDVTKALF